MIQAVLFDLDGTVLDTERIYRDGLIEGARELGLPADTIDQHSRLTGTIFEDGKRHMQGIYGEDFPFEAWFRYMRAYADRLFETQPISTKPGVPEVFDTLHEMGYQTALVTGTGRNRVDRYLTRLGMEHCFDCLVCGGDVTHGKPDPDPYLLAAQRLGLPPDQCMVVEDARSGILSAKSAGMLPVFVPDLYPAPAEVLPHIRYTVPSLSDIPDLVVSHNRSLQKNEY